MFCGEGGDVSEVGMDEEESGVMFWKRDGYLAFDSKVGLGVAWVEFAAMPEFWGYIFWWYGMVI